MIYRNPAPGRVQTLQVDGRAVDVQQIGKGTFAVAYKVVGKDEVIVIVDEAKSGDYAKSILAEANYEDHGNPHLPRVERLGEDSRGRSAFRMPLYRAPLKKADSARAWDQYKALKECWEAALADVRRSTRNLTYDGYRIMDAVVECADQYVDGDLVEALEALRDGASNYGSDWTFEFSPRNLATDSKGNLVLLDVLFSMEAMEKIRRMQRQRMGLGR